MMFGQSHTPNFKMSAFKTKIVDFAKDSQWKEMQARIELHKVF